MAPRKAPSRSLKAYQGKRNFKSTPEPSGKAGRKSVPAKTRMFCVQKHLASHLHYDFRLEHRGVLLSWAVPKGPSLNPADKRLAMQVEDHPVDYGDFEGVIPEGYGAGIVMLWDRGTWTPEGGFEDIDAALEQGELKFRLEGIKLKGSWVIVRTKGGRSGDDGASRSWLLIKHRDEWAGPIDVTEKAPDSVKSFGDFAAILGSDEPAVWQSHRPAEGGATGKLLGEVIEEAAQRRAAKPSKSRSKGVSRTTKKATAKKR